MGHTLGRDGALEGGGGGARGDDVQFFRTTQKKEKKKVPLLIYEPLTLHSNAPPLLLFELYTYTLGGSPEGEINI